MFNNKHSAEVLAKTEESFKLGRKNEPPVAQLIK